MVLGTSSPNTQMGQVAFYGSCSIRIIFCAVIIFFEIDFGPLMRMFLFARFFAVKGILQIL
jgi:hypothetical protein